MAEWNERLAQAQTRAPSHVVDAGLRAYMLGVYNYMALGLGLTGAVALFTYSTPAVFAAIFGTPLFWLVALAPLGIVFAMSLGVNRMKPATVQALFWAFAGLMGLSLASIFAMYTAADIARVFFITAASFGALSLWGYTTKRDLAPMGAFLFMGVIGLVLAMVVNIFMRSTGFDFLISVIGVLIFAGLTAYDTQRVKELYYAGMDGTVATKTSVMGALRLYLDFINMFLFLLRLLGGNRS